MAYISSITLPGGDTYNLKDKNARSAAAVATQLFGTRTNVTSDTILTLTGAYTGYESLTILFESVSGNYDRRMTVIVPVFSLRFSSWFALADSMVSGAVRIVNVTENGTVNESKIRIQATTLSSLYVNRIDAIK